MCLFTLVYAGVKKLRCQKGVFPHTQAWESPESKRSLTDIWKKYCKLPNLRTAPASSEPGLIFPQHKGRQARAAGGRFCGNSYSGTYSCWTQLLVSSVLPPTSYRSVTDGGGFSCSAFKRYQAPGNSRAILWAFCYRRLGNRAQLQFIATARGSSTWFFSLFAYVIEFFSNFLWSADTGGVCVGVIPCERIVDLRHKRTLIIFPVYSYDI